MMQNKSFLAWINMHLAKHKMKVEVRRDATPGLGVGRRGRGRGVN